MCGDSTAIRRSQENQRCRQRCEYCSKAVAPVQKHLKIASFELLYDFEIAMPLWPCFVVQRALIYG